MDNTSDKPLSIIFENPEESVNFQYVPCDNEFFVNIVACQSCGGWKLYLVELNSPITMATQQMQPIQEFCAPRESSYISMMSACIQIIEERIGDDIPYKVLMRSHFITHQNQENQE